MKYHQFSLAGGTGKHEPRLVKHPAIWFSCLTLEQTDPRPARRARVQNPAIRSGPLANPWPWQGLAGTGRGPGKSLKAKVNLGVDYLPSGRALAVQPSIGRD
ncbi:hypothetical protein GGTG_07798 [Gaeumannomyces tritici R3-111a-1]|uniref:Uncharacterized protein n=1 Tax=Gaeumannomyces tritici (strain R3-111a-1) TaxID=644352 RepID=J3P2Q3_GAET3|nr:hypothetical protein GGTG_07798 [Gaeumannomyces tritici R3-111a-1]EJT73945.1 hypothetical protein GGTG_07798 [Gaeumannomyces tritici R3-111a-1]